MNRDTVRLLLYLFNQQPNAPLAGDTTLLINSTPASQALLVPSQPRVSTKTNTDS